MKNMTVRNAWDKAYDELSLEAEYCKQSMIVPFGLMEIYDRSGNDDKQEIHQIIEEWMASDKSKFRWLAKFLISQRHIVELTFAVGKAISYLQKLPQSVQIKYEIKDLERLVAELQRQ